MTRVSVGLPVYNGEKYLEEAIESLCGQTLVDFELIISDNASTDRTPEICRAFALSDERVRYIENEHNLGAAPNFNKVFALSSAPFFKWAAHDDLLKPQFLEVCVNALQEDPEAVLAYPRAIQIDADGNFIREYQAQLEGAESDSARLRFRDLISDHHNCYPIFGVARREVLARTRLIGSFVGSDRVLLAELALHGPFVELPTALFIHREHALRSTRSIPRQSRSAWFDSSKAKRRAMPYWRYAREYSVLSWSAPLPRRERVLLGVEVLRWLVTHVKRLAADVGLMVISSIKQSGRRA